MADGYYLTEQERNYIREMVRDYRGRRRDTTRFPPSEFSEESPAPEVYIAKTPSGGIPGLGGTTINFADCTIYRVLADVITVVTGLSKKVYNPSSAALTGNLFVVIERDKFGTWLVVVGGGSSGTIIKITSSTKNGDCYPAVVESYTDSSLVLTPSDGPMCWFYPISGEPVFAGQRFLTTQIATDPNG